MNRHIKEYFKKLKMPYMCMTLIITTAYLFRENNDLTILKCLGCMALFSVFITTIYVLAKKGKI